jgi:hypothetical protein
MNAAPPVRSSIMYARFRWPSVSSEGLLMPVLERRGKDKLTCDHKISSQRPWLLFPENPHNLVPYAQSVQSPSQTQGRSAVASVAGS